MSREIIDESDVYIDVHKAIRRLAPAPKARIQQKRSSEAVNAKCGDEFTSSADQDVVLDHANVRPTRTDSHIGRNDMFQLLSTSPKTATFMMRRSSTGLGGETVKTSYPVRANIAEMREQLKHLGPSNPATNPKSTRSTTVKIKQSTQRTPSVTGDAAIDSQYEDNETTGLLKTTVPVKDGIQALITEGYGAVTPDRQRPRPSKRGISNTIYTSRQMDDGNQTLDSDAEDNSDNTSLRNYRADFFVPKRSTVRSGSITENIVESRGVRKVVLEMGSNDEGAYSAAVYSSPDPAKSQKRGSLGFFGTDSTAEDEDSGESTTGDSGRPRPGRTSGDDLDLGGGDAADGGNEMAEEGGEQDAKKKQRKKKRGKGNRW